MSKRKQKNSEKNQNITNFIVTAVLILSVILCLSVVIQVMTEGYVSIAGHSLFRVVTGSMEPTIEVGAVLLAKEVDIADLKVGDIICFFSREAGHFDMIITHRIVDIVTESGTILLETRGDANLVSDVAYVTQDNLIGLVVSYTGSDNVFATMLSFLTNKFGFLACIAVPCLFLVSLIMAECARNIRRELNRAMEVLNGEPELDADHPYQYITREEYEEMYTRIRRELMEELGLLPREQEEPSGISQEEYEQMCLRIRAELMEELKQSEEHQQP